MDQLKTGALLKELRREKGITQAQLAEIFNVSNRTVSRWETGSNMPDITLLVELADYYDVDVRELIDGERKNDKMNEEIKDVAEKMADYMENENRSLIRRVLIINCVGLVCSVLSMVLQSADLNQEPIGMMFTGCLEGFAMGTILCSILYLSGILLKIRLNMKAKKIFKITALICLGIVGMCAAILLVMSWTK